MIRQQNGLKLTDRGAIRQRREFTKKCRGGSDQEGGGYRDIDTGYYMTIIMSRAN